MPEDDKGEVAPAKERAKRKVMVLVQNEGTDSYTVLNDDVGSTSKAVKWIREHGESLVGKTVMIVNAQAPRGVGVKEAKAVITF